MFAMTIVVVLFHQTSCVDVNERNGMMEEEDDDAMD